MSAKITHHLVVGVVTLTDGKETARQKLGEVAFNEFEANGETVHVAGSKKVQGPVEIKGLNGEWCYRCHAWAHDPNWSPNGGGDVSF